MLNSAGVASLDLTTLARLHQSGTVSPEEVVAELLTRIGSFADPAVWIFRLPPEAVRAQAQAVVQRRAAGASLPLYGVPFAVKDNIDVAGYPTSAGCPAFTYTADRTAPVVARLLEAGAILVGKTNLDQFATGLSGDRSPYGACRNVFQPAYVSGGSSSGSAVAVAAGLVSFALGTDTAGSGRVPAGCNNIVGLKPTPGLLSTTGVVPACRSLDCVSVMALTAEDALRVYAVAAGEPLRPLSPADWPDEDGAADHHGFTFATPRDEDLEFFGDEDQAALFHQALDRLHYLGGHRVAVDFRPLHQVAGLLYEGPWVAERLAGVEDFLAEHAADIHPVTRAIIEGGARYTAVDLFKSLAVLKELREVCAAIFNKAEVFVVPTMPTLPTLAEARADSAGWGERLGHYTNFVNLLGWSALAVPAGFTPRGLPGGLTFIGPGGSERRLCGLGMAWQRLTNLPLGATGNLLPEGAPAEVEAARMPPGEGQVRVAVAGAHLRGQPLHPDLRSTGARFVRACRTAARYRFVALMDLSPPRPGLVRDASRLGAIAVEIYDLPVAGFGKLVASVAPPLAIGTVELEDGEAVKGFLCESWAAAVARDITDYGGWVAFREQLAATRPARYGPKAPEGKPMSGVSPLPNRKRRRTSWLAVPALLAALLSGCGASSSGNPDANTLTVGFIYIGARDDYGYNQAHANGAAAVRQLPGVKVIEAEMIPDTADCQKTMKRMIALDRARVIFATSFGYYEPHMLLLARAYPDVKFLHCGGLYDAKLRPANVGTYFGYIDECQYLSGIVAAYATRSKKLGFVAGKAIPQVRRNINAFTLGARSVDPSVTCTVVFTGDWSLPNKEVEAASTLIDQGVDVLTCHVNSPKVLIETAERRGIMTCGYHADQSSLAPKGYLTGAEWHWEKIYADYVRAIQAGKWQPGQVRGGLKEGFVRMSPYGPAVSEQAKQKADAVKAKLLDGSFVIFKGPLRDNSGRTVIPQNAGYVQSAIELETMDYLVEGAVAQ